MAKQTQDTNTEEKIVSRKAKLGRAFLARLKETKNGEKLVTLSKNYGGYEKNGKKVPDQWKDLTFFKKDFDNPKLRKNLIALFEDPNRLFEEQGEDEIRKVAPNSI